MKGYVEGAQLRDCVLSLTSVVLFFQIGRLEQEYFESLAEPSFP
jgi:hypothetical protein